MFYDNYVSLCAKIEKSPSGVAREIGLSNAAANGWKNGKMPNDTTLSKLSSYFGVSVYTLTEEKEKTPTPEGERKSAVLVNDDAELTEYLEELRSRPEMRMLFSISKGATKADIEKAVAIIEALRKTEGQS